MATGGCDKSIKDGHEMFFDWRCNRCEEEDHMTEATSYCKNCNEGFCDTCLKYHSRFLRDHDVLGQDDKDSWGEPIPSLDSGVACSKHKGQTISWYCEHHDQLCCPVCAVKQHSDVCKPKMTYIQDAAKGVMSGPELYEFKADGTKLLARIAKIENEKSVYQSALDASEKDCKRKVEETEELVLKRLKYQKSTSLSEIKNVHDVEKRKIGNDIDACAKMKVNLKEIMQQMLTTKTPGNEAAFFITMKTNKKKMEVHRKHCEELSKQRFTTFSFQRSKEVVNLKELASFGKCFETKSLQHDGGDGESIFSITVEDVGFLDQNVFGPVCMLYNLQWNILVKPTSDKLRKKDREGSLGVFLQCQAEQDSRPWSCKASSIVIKLINQKKQGESLVRDAGQHLFCSKENDWGFNKFISWKALLDPKNGYCEDNRVTFQVHLKANAQLDVE